MNDSAPPQGVTAQESATDADLWRLALTDDPQAFGVIFDRHFLAIHRFCARRTGSADRADDLVSIVFLEAWRCRHRVVLEQGTVLPWLYAVARHTVAHRARSEFRHRKVMSVLPHAVVPDHAEAVAGRIDDERRLSAVERAFAQLKPDDQDVIALCVWQGLEYAEAAVALEIPIGTVRSRLSRARARLAALVDPVSRISKDSS